MKKHISILLYSFLLVATACKKDILPSDSLTSDNIVQNPDGLINAVNGAYSLFKDHLPFNGTSDDNLMYLRQYYHLSDFSSDDIACGQKTEDPLFYSFTLDHSPTQTNTRYFWYVSYKIINDCNAVIEAGEKLGSTDPSTQQLIGECYFLRAFAHFNLVRIFAKPFTQDASAPGVILRLSTSDEAQKSRATVGEVYAAVIADAEKAAGLMTKPRGVQYASQNAAWALLSRVYLYQEENEKAIEYATKVIDAGNYTLSTKDAYPTLFANAQTSPETIFCIAFTTADDYGKFGSIASMVYSNGNSGWGEEFASKSLRTLMEKEPDDVRWSYIIPSEDDNGDIKKLNGIDVYYIYKFSGQNESPTLSSPVMFRLAEMYLNRAEAEAKLNQTDKALDDVDEIRKNRGLENALYEQAVPAGSTALDVVLDERRIELAFEGHRTYDVYRNKRNMQRVYWGYHIPGLKETDINPTQEPVNYPNTVTDWSNNRIIYYIPIDEVQTNKLCQQND